MTDQEEYLISNETNLNSEFWIQQEFVPEFLRKQLRMANILILPQFSLSNEKVPAFPNKTEDVLSYLKNESLGNIIVDICIDSRNYRELSLHSYEINIGTFVFQYIFAPVFVALMAEYIKRKVFRTEDNPIVNINVYIEKNPESSREIRFRKRYSEYHQFEEEVLRYSKKGIEEVQREKGENFDGTG